MYVRTPKRYTRGGQRRRVVSLKRLSLWLITPLLIFIGIGVYQNRDQFIPPISNAVEGIFQNAQDSLATATAPTPTPTPDPRNRIEQANREWEDVGAIGRAVSLYQEVWESVPNDVQVHYRVTLGLIMAGRLEQALEAAERTVNADPFSSDAWAIHAWALDWNERPNEAIASALMALELNPDNARAHAFLAEAYLSLNLPQRAISSAQKALDLDPDSFEAHRARGLIYQYAEFDIVSALAEYRTALEIAPNMSYIAVDLAVIDFNNGNIATALGVLQDIIDRSPEDTLALYWLGHIQRRGVGDLGKAAEYLSRCVENNPRSISCNYELGRTQFDLGDASLASESFNRAIEVGSANPYHYYWAGNAKIALGNCSAALVYLRPGYEIAKAGTDANIISSYEALFPSCQIAVDPIVPEVTAAPEDGGA